MLVTGDFEILLCNFLLQGGMTYSIDPPPALIDPMGVQRFLGVLHEALLQGPAEILVAAKNMEMG